jgi:peroxiredoxin
VDTWFQLPAGAKTLDISSFRGKSVVLFGFQSWCPGCHSRGFPTIKAIRQHFQGRDDVAVVAIQTVFEGFGTNTAERALEDVKRYGLDIPVGHDPGPGGRGSVIMRRYRSGGTPWIILIDPNGVVRFNHFRIQPQKAIAMIEGWSTTGPR